MSPSTPAPSNGLPFDDIRNLLPLLPGPDAAALAAVKARDCELTKPPGALGRMEEIVEWLASWQASPQPIINKPMMAIFATSHGLAESGVSAFPPAVNAQMLANFTAGGAAINQICMANDISLRVFDLAVDLPTPNILTEDAFDEAGCAATIAYGMEAVADGCDLLCLGEMGIGNTAVSAGILMALYGGTADDWVGPGTGVAGDALAHKKAIVTQVVARLDGEKNPLEILRRIGGREIAAMVGAILAARLQRIPVLLDGFVTVAAAAIVQALSPSGLDHCLASHLSAEPAHAKALARLGKLPLLSLGMRLGEGSGAGLAVPLVRTAAAIHRGMATFASAGVSKG